MSQGNKPGNGHDARGHDTPGHDARGQDASGEGGGTGAGRPAGDTGPRAPGRDAPRPLPRRFYKDVTIGDRDGAFAVLLDGRPVRTPAKRDLALPTKALADAIAAEFAAQGDVVDPATMPVTRIVNSALDGVAPRRGEVAADVAKYSGSDLVCYRADAPAQLIAEQARHWDPVVDWAARALGVRPRIASGIMPVTQPPELGEAVLARLVPLGAIELAAMHVMTTLTGSALLPLAHQMGDLSAEAAWIAAHVDEDWQIHQWGEDAEAVARRAIRRAEFDAAVRVLAAAAG